MINNNFSEDIRRRFGVKEIDTKTMIFRFNGFVSACNLDLEKNMWQEKVSDSDSLYIFKQSEEKNHEYNIVFSVSYEAGKGNILVLLGKYNDLSLFLVNYCDIDKNKFRVSEIPFCIKLKKPKDEYTYLLEIESNNKNALCTFKMTKSRENIDYGVTLNFYGTVSFSEVLKIVESFVINPEHLFNQYNNVISNKKLHFTTEELTKTIIDEDKHTVKSKKR